MAKFNVVQKQKRAQIAERKRLIHGDPVTGKLKNMPQALAMSGKRKRKLLRKWRKGQKEAIENGLVTMQDVEMATAEGKSQKTTKAPRKFQMKKNLKLNHIKRKGKNKTSSKPTVEASADAMVE
ncbi:hypothetical protein SLEP1_g18784 [Rubroshorea leprosula]|uniref:Uncharacterized protein n=2 Tax=Rubroshorea leprosula TaxID=152421 RepID=A0AAV5IYN4_9ROSI|nr:hypothetical protein SLEP1_g18784 [Rubroshorea leprosula]